MKVLRFTPPLLALAVLAFAADVSVDYNHHAHFSHYHTYSWIGVRAGNQLWQDRIMQSVDSELSGKGWRRVEPGGEAAVSAFGHTTERDTLQTYYGGFPGWGWRGWAGMGTATTSVIPERVGNLTVDIFDGSNKQLLWRGTASDVLSDKPEKNDKKLSEAVDKMFKNFPPPEKG